MPFALLIIGIALLVSAVRGTQGDLFTLLRGDFTGPNNFIYWTVAILFIGSIGYIPKLKPVSVGFLTLVVLVLVLKRGDPDPNKAGGGFFEKFTDALHLTNSAATQLPVKDQHAAERNPLPGILDNIVLATQTIQ